VQASDGGISFVSDTLARGSRGKLAYDDYITLGTDATLVRVPTEEYKLSLVYKRDDSDVDMPLSCIEGLKALPLYGAVLAQAKMAQAQAMMAQTEGYSWKKVRLKEGEGEKREEKKKCGG